MSWKTKAAAWRAIDDRSHRGALLVQMDSALGATCNKLTVTYPDGTTVIPDNTQQCVWCELFYERPAQAYRGEFDSAFADAYRQLCDRRRLPTSSRP
jgi:hypothetical protein